MDPTADETLPLFDDNGEDVVLTDDVFSTGTGAENAVREGDAVDEHDDTVFGQTEAHALQAWESSLPALTSHVDWMNALFNSDPRLPFQVLHLGALLSIGAEGTTLDLSSATDTPSHDPFESLRLGQSPVTLRRVPRRPISRAQAASAREREDIALIAPALSPRLGRRPRARRMEKMIDDVIRTRSGTALRQFVSPEALTALGRHRTTEIWHTTTGTKRSRTALPKKRM